MSCRKNPKKITTHLADGSLNPDHLKKRIRLLFPEKKSPDFDEWREENYMLDAELERNGYLLHIGPSGPGVRITERECDAKESDSDDDSTSKNNCHCAGRHTCHCPLNNAGLSHKRIFCQQMITRAQRSLA